MRFRNWLELQGWWDQAQETALYDKYRQEVLAQLKVSEKVPTPLLVELVSDVYSDIPTHLQQQLGDLRQHLAKYPQDYPKTSGEKH